MTIHIPTAFEKMRAKRSILAKFKLQVKALEERDLFTSNKLTSLIGRTIEFHTDGSKAQITRVEDGWIYYTVATGFHRKRYIKQSSIIS